MAQRSRGEPAEVKIRTLLGKLMCNGTEPSSILEQDIFQILEMNYLKDKKALYKTSKQKFVLVFGPQDSASQYRSTELTSLSGDVKVSLLFREGRRAPAFVTSFCTKYISDRTVKLAFSNSGEVTKVFTGTHKFNRKIKNRKRHIKILKYFQLEETLLCCRGR